MARTASPGDSVLYVLPSGQLCPATVIASLAGSKAVLSLQSPDSPWNATIESSVQNTDGTTAGTWDFATLSGLKLGYAADAVAGDAATVDKPSGRFIKDTSGVTFVLTNSNIVTGTLVRVIKETAEANSRTILSVVVYGAAHTATVTFSGAVASNTTCAFYLVN